jgi:hypothetical protein
MSHYFDDMFQRTLDIGTPASGGMPRVRRSSTYRSIGARSDFDTNGEDDARSTANSVFHHDDPERAKEKAEADEHMHNYIADQLSRYKSENFRNGPDHEEEFETKA